MTTCAFVQNLRPALHSGHKLQVHKCTTWALLSCAKKHIIGVSQPPQENVSPGSHHAGDMQGRIMSASNARIVDRYTPRVIPPERWKEISSFVRRSVSQVVTDDLTPDQVRTLLRLTTILTDHVVTAQGRELRVETVFTDTGITALCENTLSSKSAHVRGASRSALRFVARAVNPHFDGKPAVPEYGVPDKGAPYTDREVLSLRQWAESERTPNRQEQARLLLALTLGAGLHSCEVARLTAADVVTDSQGVLVYPHGYRGAPRRQVPVESAWSEVIARSAATASTPGQWLFRPARQATHTKSVTSLFLKRSFRPSGAPDMLRARTTWVVRQLTKGIPEHVVLAAAGLKDLQHYRQFLTDAGETCQSTYRQLFHNSHTQITPPGLHIVRA